MSRNLDEALDAMDEVLADSATELAKARRTVDRHECATRGHEFEIISRLGNSSPLRIICRRDCGQGPWEVQR